MQMETKNRALFPYESYRKAVEVLSNTLNRGVEVLVAHAEKDPEGGAWLLDIQALGAISESELEGGTVTQTGADGGIAFAGEIVSYDPESEILMLRSGASGTPVEGAKAVVRPPDYLRRLREFAQRIDDGKAEGSAHDARFMRLRKDLLLPASVPAVPAGAAGLRDAQCAAVGQALARDFSFVWGPPGTGKSYTLGHLATRLVAEGKRVLVVSPTNAAVDTLTFALDDAFNRAGAPLALGELVRYTRTLTKRDEYARRPHLMAYTKLLESFLRKEREIERKLRALEQEVRQAAPGSDALQAARLKVAAASQELLQVGAERRRQLGEMVAGAKVLCASVTCCIFNDFQSCGFDAVLVDEASLIPLATWPCLLHASAGRRFVVAGDPMQLPPVLVRGREMDENVKTWFGHNIFTYVGLSNCRGAAPFFRVGSATLLREQTRMRKGICDLVSRTFYEGLVTGDREGPRLEWAAEAGVPAGDVVLVDPERCAEPYGLDRVPPIRRKNANASAANAVLELLRRLEHGLPEGRELSVLLVTPFRGQHAVYRSRLRGRTFRPGFQVACNTIHRCQGDEADIVIFDLVDPRHPFITSLDAGHLWCVACSRAREKLFVVGNAWGVRRGYWSGRMLADIPSQGLPEAAEEDAARDRNAA